MKNPKPILRHERAQAVGELMILEYQAERIKEAAIALQQSTDGLRLRLREMRERMRDTKP